MAVYFAYFLVVIIWSTTPLAIQWSSDKLSFIAAVLLRMFIAFVVGIFVAILLRRKLLPHRGVWPVYLAGAFGVFPNMPVVYWSAQKIPSGLVAVIFALSPFVTGVLTWIILKENPFTPRRCVALLLALLGLVIIFRHQIALSTDAWLGVLGILSSSLMFCFSSVLVKKWSGRVDPFNQMLGTLLYSLPGLFVTWWWLDGSVPNSFSPKALGAIIYLALLGSLLGATLFFFVLQKMSASSVSLITLITPVIALFLGGFIGHESLSSDLLWGAGLVLLALLSYLDIFGARWFFKALKRDAWAKGGEGFIKSYDEL